MSIKEKFPNEFLDSNDSIYHFLCILYEQVDREPICCCLGRRRLDLILKTLEPLSLTEDPPAKGFVQCIRLYFRTIPEPLVSMCEIQHLLIKLVLFFKYEPNIIEPVIKLCQDLYKSDCPRIREPRSLKHLCRIRVRNILLDRPTLLPNSVKKLDIPRQLHKYVLCVEDMDT